MRGVSQKGGRAFFLVCFVMSFFWLLTPLSAAQYAAIVIDAHTGRVLHRENEHAVTHPASLTKIMTLYLLFDALEAKKIKMTTRFKVSPHAASQAPSKLGLKPGSTILVRDAILALITKSANDIACVVGENLGGTESAFAELMTAKARELGLRQTQFKNASGLPHKYQVTTAADIALLSQSLLKRHPKYYRFFSTIAFHYRGQKHGNHNKLLGKVRGVDGIKTGFINASGWNIVTSAVRNGKRLIGVVLGGENRLWRDKRMQKLLDIAFKKDAEKKGMMQPALYLKPALPGKDQKLYMVEAAQKNPLLAPQKIPLEKLIAVSMNEDFEESEEETLEEDSDNEEEEILEAKLPARRLSGEFSIQVGAYKSAKQAQRQATLALTSLPKDLPGKVLVKPSLKKRKKLYRARITGLSQEAADRSCRSLIKAGASCITLKEGPGPKLYTAMR